MASTAQVKKFIEEIAPHCQNAYKIVGKVKPSVAIGMACVESAYGTAGSCKHNSFLGFKVGSGKTATKYWGGKFFKSKTKEEYTVGTHTVITDAFRAYDSMELCVLNFYELLNTGHYAPVKADADYRTQMQQIKSCGYMTSSTEVNSVIKIIEKYDLTKYDGAEVYHEPTASIKKGAKGNCVKWIQSMLNKKGFNLVIDGIFGNATEESVKQFQKDRGLIVDGIVGIATRTALKA